ncbi:MAG: hypothetical protein M1817_001732 [Caeruleum heppii]|nr:MAG: hypothetical protein M1817_001732 [Caeruleum heppii]
MSEYWKSTPKYWCKHCKIYVRDTKVEKEQHESTGKHQGNLKRFLRDLHRGHEREERDKDRAKQEVERLNSVVSGELHGPSRSPSTRSHVSPSTSSRQTLVTPQERKRQLAQLADMGVSIPEEFRGEMAMTGDWQTVSETIIVAQLPDHAREDSKEKDCAISTGVRKRKSSTGENDRDEGEEMGYGKAAWGSTVMTYPGTHVGQDDILDLLHPGSHDKIPRKYQSQTVHEGPEGSGDCDEKEASSSGQLKSSGVKTEESESDSPPRSANLIGNTAPQQDQQEPIVFKKRKSKGIKRS